MVTVKLFGTFRLDSGIKELKLDARTVKDILPIIMDEVIKKDPDTKLSIKDLKGCIVSRNGKQIKMSTSLNDGDVLYLVPAVGGG